MPKLVDPRERRSESLRVTLTKAERRTIAKRAREIGLTLSTYIRSVAVQAARKEPISTDSAAA